jgi:membrane glycosyltransferase
VSPTDRSDRRAAGPATTSSAKTPPSNALATTALILGILSVAAPASIFVYPPAIMFWLLLALFTLFLVVPVLVILGFAAAVMGIVALRAGEPRWLSIGGIGAGLVGGIANILVPIFFKSLGQWLI